MALVDWALWYAERGFYVFPTREKHEGTWTTKEGVVRELFPKQPRYTGGVHTATTDRNQILAWWKRNPDSAIAVNCGMSNLFAVDVDRHGDVDGVAEFKKLGIDHSGALLSLTANKGIHLVFRGTGRTTSNSKLGLDTRGENGYIILPPSFILDGEHKKYYVAKSDWSKEPAPIPDGLFEKLGIESRNDIVRNTPKHEIGLTAEIQSAKKALERLGDEYYNNHSNWVLIGMTLHSLGEDGYKLWCNWANQSEKHDEGICRYTWNKLDPKDIKLGTLYHHAYKKGL